MKKIFTATIICIFLTNLGGCKENERIYFETDYTALNIWFGTSDALGTSSTVAAQTIYNFAYHNDMDSVMFYARVSGVMVNYDRPFELEAVSGDINKVEYLFGNYMIPAGRQLMQFPIYFKKPANFNEFKESDGTIVFKVKANTEFREGAQGRDHITVTLRDRVGKPENWDEEVSSLYRALTYFFGTYSNVKYTFIIQVTGLSNFRVYASNTNLPEIDNLITNNEGIYLNRMCRAALVEYNATHTEPLSDEFGPIEFPSR